MKPITSSKNHRLPTTRYQVFFDCLKNRYSVLFKIGLAILLFASPILIIQFLSNIAIYEVNLYLKENLINQLDAAEQLLKIYNTRNLLFIPAILVLGVGMTGLSRVTRNLVFYEPIYFIHDLVIGIKKNTKVLFMMFGLGALNFLFQLVVRSDATAGGYLLATILMLVICVVMLMLAPYFIFQTELYNLSLISTFKNSFILAMRFIHYTLLVLLVLSLPWLITLIDNEYVFFFGTILILLLICPIQLLIITLIMFSLFDVSINKDNFQEIYRKGLYKECQE